MNRFAGLLCLAALFCASIHGHGDDSHFGNRQDVTVKTTKVGGNVYMLQGRGGNVGALVGPEGILIVDADYKAVSSKLREALKALGSERPRFVLNTHWHDDHTQGNYEFGTGSTIIAHINVRKRLMAPPVIFGQATPAYPSHALPILTYSETMSVHLNGEEVRLVHFPNGHTDGDTVVFFEGSRVVHFGDHFFNGMYPFVDLDSGGSVQGLISNIGKLIEQVPADAKLIPGHGGLATLADLKSYHQALSETTEFVRAAMQNKKTLDEIKKTGLPEKYKKWGEGFIKTDMWIETVYNSLAKK